MSQMTTWQTENIEIGQYKYVFVFLLKILTNKNVAKLLHPNTILYLFYPFLKGTDISKHSNVF